MKGLRGFGKNLPVLIKMVIHAGVEFNDCTANPERCTLTFFAEECAVEIALRKARSVVRACLTGLTMEG